MWAPADDYYLPEYIKKNIDVSIITANTNKKKLFDSKMNFICPKSNRWNNSSRFIKTLVFLGLIVTKLPIKKTSIFSFQYISNCYFKNFKSKNSNKT